MNQTSIYTNKNYSHKIHTLTLSFSINIYTHLTNNIKKKNKQNQMKTTAE